jgi:hypothetical protein
MSLSKKTEVATVSLSCGPASWVTAQRPQGNWPEWCRSTQKPGANCRPPELPRGAIKVNGASPS